MDAENSTPEEGTPVDGAPEIAVPENAAPLEATPEATPDAVETVDAVEPAASAAAPVQTVYVTAPNPPKPRGNRGMGTMLAVLATIVFAAAYLGVVALLILFISPSNVASGMGQFVTGPQFWVPVLVFFVVMILWALLANRASWWSWVIGSLVIAAVTYFATIAVLLLMQGGFSLTGSKAAILFATFALNPALIAAAFIARECAIWFGAAIAKRGRKVRERNYEAWQQFESEEAQKRAEFGGVAAV